MSASEHLTTRSLGHSVVWSFDGLITVASRRPDAGRRRRPRYWSALEEIGLKESVAPRPLLPRGSQFLSRCGPLLNARRYRYNPYAHSEAQWEVRVWG